nr:MAG TPA: hypothetical protein [Caudoviricetes sp.]
MANQIINSNNLTSKEIPELYVRYFNPKIKINTDITIPYYVSDNTQAEYLNNSNAKSFTTVVTFNSKVFSSTTTAGEFTINIGSISTAGETYFSIYTIDANGVASVEQFFDILIIDDTYPITQSQTYTMTSADLSTYNIKDGESVSISDAKLNGAALTNLFKGIKNKGYRKIVMLNNTYMLDYHGDKVTLPDQFTVDMNGATFKATQCNDINVSNLVDLRDCFDSHVVNGKLVGNYDGFDFEATKTNTNYNIPGEGLAVAEINGSKYSSFENMEMGYSVGYNLGVFGGKKSGYIGTPGKLAFKNQYYIDANGNQVSSSDMCTTDIIDISTLLDRGELQCSVYLGYGGLALNKAELFMHFYGNSQNYLKTIKTRQYQVVKIPSGAKYARITGFTSVTESSGMTICHTGQATNCELINIKSHNTRTCAMHPGIYNHLLIKNCTFNKVADENEYKVTKLALDFEDGYENGRNLFFINNEVYQGTSALTVQRCFNCNVIKCRNFGLDFRGHIKGGLIKNNFFNDGTIYTTSFDSQSHLKLDNNTFFNTLKFLKWDDTGDYSTIGLTKLDCKQNYQNNSNINVVIDKASSGSGGGEITPETLTISNIPNITQPEKSEFYIEYSTNIAVTKHEVSWDGGNTFYDKTSDVIANGTSYKFKHDNSATAGTYNIAIRVTTAGGTTKTSNIFTVTLQSASTPEPEPGTIGNMTYGKGIDQTTHLIKDDAACWATVKAVTVEQGATYTLQMDGTWVWGYAFDDSDNYVSELFTSTGNNNYTYTFTAPTNKIRYGCYDPGKYLSYCKLTKISGGSSGGGDSNTEYATSCTSSYILDKMYPMPQNHEALPSGVKDTWATQSRWENQQRPTAIAHNCGQAGCPGAVAFRALGAWANVYRVKDSGFSANTGVEMRNIKVYGWYNGQWEKVQDLAVPNGNFYAESFSGDSNQYFSDSIKTTSTSKTIILREANKINNENCMYHPFSDIKNFDTKYEYVYTCIDLRKVKWDESGTDDRDSSHYCASCGGDWWLAEGLTFDSSWQHNKGVAQPKIIEITKEWRRFSMTTVPQGWTNGFPQ